MSVVSSPFLCLPCNERRSERICPDCGSDLFDGDSMWEAMQSE